MSRMNVLRFAAWGLMVSALACGGGGFETDPIGTDEGAAVSGDTLDEALPDEAGDAELGTAQQALIGSGSGISFLDSCNDPTGVDPVLAALAVSSATELHRWQPKSDFQVSGGMLKLTTTGKKQCADGQCFNTQALLDLQNNAASKAEIRPGVRVNPTLLRTSLSLAYFRQQTCFTLLGLPLIGCSAPDHKFTLAHTAPGQCDTNYWFTVTTSAGKSLTSALLGSLEKSLIWLNTESNEYIQFQTNGNMVGVDPTYGLNEVGSTSTGSCSAACTKITKSNVTGQCCSCNGMKKYARSAWSTNTYICQ
jgi:hypothetical protein